MAQEIDESKVNETKEVPPVVEENKPDNKADDEEKTRLKAAISKANSEAAEWKRKYTATLDEAKRKEMEAAEARKAELEELETLRKDKRISTYKARLMDAGIDGATADLMATVLPDGVSDDYFTALKTFNANQRKAADVAALNNQPGLSVGLPPAMGGKSEFDKQLDKIFGL